MLRNTHDYSEWMELPLRPAAVCRDGGRAKSKLSSAALSTQHRIASTSTPLPTSATVAICKNGPGGPAMLRGVAIRTEPTSSESREKSIIGTTTKERPANDASDQQICDTCNGFGKIVMACGVIEEYNGVSATGHEWFTMTPGQKAGSGRLTGEIREYGACPKCGGSGRTKEVDESSTTPTHIDKAREEG